MSRLILSTIVVGLFIVAQASQSAIETQDVEISTNREHSSKDSFDLSAFFSDNSVRSTYSTNFRSSGGGRSSSSSSRSTRSTPKTGSSTTSNSGTGTSSSTGKDSPSSSNSNNGPITNSKASAPAAPDAPKTTPTSAPTIAHSPTSRATSLSSLSSTSRLPHSPSSVTGTSATRPTTAQSTTTTTSTWYQPVSNHYYNRNYSNSTTTSTSASASSTTKTATATSPTKSKSKFGINEDHVIEGPPKVKETSKQRSETSFLGGLLTLIAFCGIVFFVAYLIILAIQSKIITSHTNKPLITIKQSQDGYELPNKSISHGILTDCHT